MTKPLFYIVDVFATEKYAGNQLAVFKNIEDLPEADLQKIANEMNYSETTFILSDEKTDDGYDVRIFTPKVELPFAGHPTLGTAYIIQREIIKEKIKTVKLNLKVGQIPVDITYKNDIADELWMKQKAPEFGKSFDSQVFAELLGLEKSDIDDRFPAEEVSTGFYTFIVPLRSINAVKKARVNQEAFNEFIHDTEAKVVLIFAPETYGHENDLNVRFFADQLGIPEDPATGSANGCLAGYLVKNRFFGEDAINIRVEQGYEIDRKSLLFLKANNKRNTIDVFVGGNVQMIATCELSME